jgi:hypothetical protein
MKRLLWSVIVLKIKIFIVCFIFDVDGFHLIKLEVISLLFQLKQFKRSTCMIYYRHEKRKRARVCVSVCASVCWLVGYKAHNRRRRRNKIHFKGI